MNNNQKITPKYWIFHDKTSDDVFIATATASKSLDSTYENAKKLYPNEFEEFELDNSNYAITLFEVDITH